MQQTKDIRLDARIDYEAFREFFDPVNAITDECRLQITEDGWHVDAVDPANVAMVRAELPAEAFDEYDAGEINVGINLRQILRPLKEIEDTAETLSLVYNEGGRKLTVETEFYEYTYSTIDPEYIREDPTIPDLDLSATVGLQTDRLARAARYFKSFATHVTVGYDVGQNEFYMEAMEKEGTDDGEFRLPRDELGIRTSPGDAWSKYSLDYFTDMTDSFPPERDVTLKVGEEFPFSLTYEIAPVDGPGDRYHGEVEHMQAPRIAAE